MPNGLLEQQDGVSAFGHGAGDLVEVKLHGLRVGEGQRQRCASAASRTDCAEIGAVGALVGGLARPRSPPGPLAHEAGGVTASESVDWDYILSRKNALIVGEYRSTKPPGRSERGWSAP